MVSVFDFEDHYSYLIARLDKAANSRGIKGRFSEHVRIQPAFLSQVLAKKYPLSLEQADLGNSFLDHNLEESEFFLLLVSRDRAGSLSLRRHFTKQINHCRRRRMEVVQRLGKKGELSDETKGIYYSSWIYAATHVALTIPELRRLDNLVEYFGVKRRLLMKVLGFLEQHRLISHKGGEFIPTQRWIRLERSSPFVSNLHCNWRHKAIQNQDDMKEEDLHFSGVYSLDSKTAAVIREALLDSLATQVKKIEDAPEKDLYVLNMDFFGLKRKTTN